MRRATSAGGVSVSEQETGVEVEYFSVRGIIIRSRGNPPSKPWLQQPRLVFWLAGHAIDCGEKEFEEKEHRSDDGGLSLGKYFRAHCFLPWDKLDKLLSSITEADTNSRTAEWRRYVV